MVAGVGFEPTTFRLWVEKEFKDIVFLSYEQSKNKDIAQKLNIKFWTTIIVYKGDAEIIRIIGQTDKETIYSAIQKGIWTINKKSS